jgi:hypothetical protein
MIQKAASVDTEQYSTTVCCRAALSESRAGLGLKPAAEF